MVGETEVEGDLWNLIPKLTLRNDRSIILDAQLRESFGRVVYSHKAHEKEADILLAKLAKIKLGQSCASCDIDWRIHVTVLLGTGWWGSLIGGVFSAALLALNLVHTQL